MKRAARFLLASTCLLGTDLVTASPAFAHAEAEPAPTSQGIAKDEPGDVIIVTGSRIARPDLTAASPVTVIQGETLKLTNTVTAESILQQSPQFVAAANSTSNNPGFGVATVDLRGLGPRRTLVLVDGKRLATYNAEGEVDLNIIPPALIKRVDVLTGGASAVYGSDAIAGVVNFILDDRFVGLRADGSASITEHGDGALFDASLTGGLAIKDRGNLVLSLGYSKRNPIRQSDRAFSRQPLNDQLEPVGSINAVPTVIDNTFNLVPGAPDFYQVGPNGDLVDFYAPFNYAVTEYLQVPFERANATLLGRFDVTDSLEAFGRATWVRSQSELQLGPPATFGLPFDISPDNPFLTSQQSSLIFGDPAALNPDGTVTLAIRQRMGTAGGRRFAFDGRVYQLLGGLRGDFGQGLKWEMFTQYSESKRFIDFKNDLSYTRVSQAIDAVDGPGGIACRDPSGGCRPLNPFGLEAPDQATLDFISASARQTDRTSQFVAGGNLTGDLTFLTTPWSEHPAAFAAGVEYRRESGSTRADPAYASGDLIAAGQGAEFGPNDYDVKEAFAELKVPVVEDRPFVHELGLEAGARVSGYSTVGTVFTYKAGGDWSPVDGLRFRSIYQHAVRAPNIYELYSPRSIDVGSVTGDPCAGASVTAGSALADLCVATGVPAALIGLLPQPPSGSVNIAYGGNADLNEEKSNTFTAGVVINPAVMRNLSLSVDYFKIKVNDAIRSFGGSPDNVLQACYDIYQDPSSPYCQALHRNPLTGRLDGGSDYFVFQGYANIATMKTSGIDVSGVYHGRLDSRTTFGLIMNGTYTSEWELKPEAQQPNIKCAGRFGAACNMNPIPKWKHVADLTLKRDALSFLLRWRYFGAVKEDAGTEILVGRIPAYNSFDTTLSIDINAKAALRLGVQNALDKDPPIIGNWSGSFYNNANTFPNVYDVFGRTFFAGATLSF